MRQDDTVQAVSKAPRISASQARRTIVTTSDRVDRRRSSRFVTQSHALGTPLANPAALAVAAAIAVALYLVGRKLSD